MVTSWIGRHLSHCCKDLPCAVLGYVQWVRLCSVEWIKEGEGTNRIKKSMRFISEPSVTPQYEEVAGFLSLEAHE